LMLIFFDNLGWITSGPWLAAADHNVIKLRVARFSIINIVRGYDAARGVIVQCRGAESFLSASEEKGLLN
jgi:hypothetical protein